MNEVPLYVVNEGGTDLGRRTIQSAEQLLHRNVQRFRSGLVFKAHRLCVSLSARLESNKEAEKVPEMWCVAR